MRIIKLILIGLVLGIFAKVSFANGEGLDWSGALSSSNMGSQQTRRVGNVMVGKLLDVRPAVIEVEASYGAKAAGASIGGALGAAIGSKMSKSSAVGGLLLGTVGGILGGVAGDALATKRVQGVEMIVLVEKTGEMLAVTQELKGTQIPDLGSNVYITNINGMTRVYPAGTRM